MSCDLLALIIGAICICIINVYLLVNVDGGPSCRNRRQKPEKSVNGKCKHRLVFSCNCQDNRGNVFPIYKCEKCGYEQIGKEHLRLEEYEN